MSTSAANTMVKMEEDEVDGRKNTDVLCSSLDGVKGDADEDEYDECRQQGAEAGTKPDVDVDIDDLDDDATPENANDSEAENDEEDMDDYEPKEPNYVKTNSLSFAKFCHVLETLWKQRKRASTGLKGVPATKDQLLQYLLPDTLRKHLGIISPAGAAAAVSSANTSSSPYPLFRLILPEIDFARPHNGMKEKNIAITWGAAMGLRKGSPPYVKLERFHDPTAAGPTAAGDLSVALQEVMAERYGSKGSRVTVGQINDLLDELAVIKKGSTLTSNVTSGRSGEAKAESPSVEVVEGNADNFTRSSSANSFKPPRQKSNFSQQQALRIKWVEKLITLNLSPVEHKWVVRILLQKLEIGLGWQTIIRYYHPFALHMFSANRNLRSVCAALSDPEWVRRRHNRIELQQKAIEEHHTKNHMPRSTEGAILGNTLGPMLAHRTGFADVLRDMGSRHQMRLDSLPDDAPAASSLALKFPAFLCEVKLDGERMIVHVNRGIVTMHTRNATWYSRIYSPIIGPAIRRAIAMYDIDVILDGEMIAWDNVRKENILFGNNRSVAKARKAWLQRNGRLNENDMNLHQNEPDKNVMSEDMSDTFLKSSSRAYNDTNLGKDCWMKFVAFDALYVNGPGVHALMQQVEDLYKSPLTPEFAKIKGSILHLDGYQRRTILHKLMVPQDFEVEVVQSMVIGSDGLSHNPEKYFCKAREDNIMMTVLDSIDNALSGTISSLAEIDKHRRQGRSDKQIHEARAWNVEKFYNEIVERRGEEGLVFKDLAAPYVLGQESRNLGYWRKLKSDYEQLSHASDIDVVVLGGFFATGLGAAGIINHFLVGCADRQADGHTLYMPLTKISGGGTKRSNLDRLLEHTGFKVGTEKSGIEFGRWFKAENHGKGLPAFISSRSYQRSVDGDNKGWKFDRSKHYPDLWIDPEDSFVFTINAGEIITSDLFSAGVTLRFPRIHKIRVDGFDGGPKHATEVESVEHLHEIFRNWQARLRNEAHSDAVNNDAATIDPISKSRFLPAIKQKNRLAARKRQGTAASSAVVSSSRIDSDAVQETTALEGLTFTVLEGRYTLENKSIERQVAKLEGWFEEAKQVHSRQDVIDFIFRHGGKCELTGSAETDFMVGGRVDDARVITYRRALNVVSSDALGHSKSLKNKRSALMSEVKGVVKWTFVMSAACKWLNKIKSIKREELEKEEGGPKDAMAIPNRIKDDEDSLMKPGRHDFLVLSKVEEQLLLLTEDRFGDHLWDDSNVVSLRRTLEEVKRQKRKSCEYAADDANARPSLSPTKTMTATPLRRDNGIVIFNSLRDFCLSSWKETALSSLEEDERWIMGGMRQAFWPYSRTTAIGKDDGKSTGDRSEVVDKSAPRWIGKGKVIIYPDVFGDDFGVESEKQATEELSSPLENDDKKSKRNRWQYLLEADYDDNGEITSALPIAKVMGAIITPHLHDGVTHIVVSGGSIINDDCDIIKWSRSIPLDIPTSRPALHLRLVERVERLYRRSDVANADGDVFLVTARWIRSLWND